jgi:hypothetical protein
MPRHYCGQPCGINSFWVYGKRKRRRGKREKEEIVRKDYFLG